MPTVYGRDDSGAPALTYLNNQGSIAQFNALKTILKACLVSGYGAKPAAGWALIAEGDRYLVLRNGTSTGYVCFTWTGSNFINIYLAETFTGVTNDVMTGDGLKTGTAGSNAEPQRMYTGAIAFHTSYSSWSMVADEKSFILQAAGAISLVWEFAATDVGAMMPLYVGEDSLGNFIAVGGTNQSSTSNPPNNFSSAGFTALRDPVTGLLVGSGGISVVMPGLYRAQPATMTDPVIQLLEAPMCPVRWGTSSGQLSGKLRGVALCPQLADYYPSPAAKCLGLKAGLNSRNSNQPLPMGPDTYFMGISYINSARFLITTKAEFW